MNQLTPSSPFMTPDSMPSFSPFSDLDLSSLTEEYGTGGFGAISYIKEKLAAESLFLSYNGSIHEFTIIGSASYKKEDLSSLLRGNYSKCHWYPSLLQKTEGQNFRLILVPIKGHCNTKEVRRLPREENTAHRQMFNEFFLNVSVQKTSPIAVDWFFKKYVPPGSFQKKIKAPEFNPASFLYHFGVAGVNTLTIMKNELEKKSLSLAYSEVLRAFIIQGSFRFEKEEIEGFLKKNYVFLEPKVIGRNYQRNFVVLLAKIPFQTQRRARESDLFLDEDLGASLWEEKKKSLLERFKSQKQKEITQHLKKLKPVEISASVAKIAASTARAKVIKDFSEQMFKMAEFIDQILFFKQLLLLQDYSVPKDKNKISKAISWFFKTYAPPGYLQKRIEGSRT